MILSDSQHSHFTVSTFPVHISYTHLLMIASFALHIYTLDATISSLSLYSSTRQVSQAKTHFCSLGSPGITLWPRLVAPTSLDCRPWLLHTRALIHLDHAMLLLDTPTIQHCATLPVLIKLQDTTS